MRVNPARPLACCVLLHFKPAYCFQPYFRLALFGVSVYIKNKKNTVCGMHRHNHYCRCQFCCVCLTGCKRFRPPIV